tara:strand:- start:595 stop:1683 length:1089 start_codon:yes stop_codon:yes gene_type:complete
MKIIFISTKSITFNTFLETQANYFFKKGLDVEVACSDIENLNFKNKVKHRIDFPNKILELFNLVKYIKIFLQVRKIVKQNSETLFYLHTPMASFLFRLFTFFNNLKIIYFVHGFRFNSKTNFIKSLFFKSIENILSFNTNIFITINNEDYKYAKVNFQKNSLCFKINGVGLSLPKNHFKKKIVKKKKIKRILVIAAYKKDKGYFDLLKVAEMLKNNKIKIECYGYGNNNIFQSLKIKKKLKNIFFKKFDKNLKNKIKNYDLLLHLSKREGLPVAVMESLAEALPVICYDIRGNNDLIKHQYNGIFINSYKEVADKIFYLCLDDNFFNKMRFNAFKSINKSFLRKETNINIYNILNDNFKNIR